MRTLILYAGRYGCTEDCVKHLEEQLRQEVATADLKNPGKKDLRQYDWIIIGGSVYMGRIQREVKMFCEQNLPVLLRKKIALFICCTTPGQADEYFRTNFPAVLLEHAAEMVNFGGELRPQKMGFFDRKIAALASRLEPRETVILYRNIDQLAGAVSRSGDEQDGI